MVVAAGQVVEVVPEHASFGVVCAGEDAAGLAEEGLAQVWLEGLAQVQGPQVQGRV